MEILKKIFSFISFPAIIAGSITFIYWLFIIKAMREGWYFPEILWVLTVVFFSWFMIIVTLKATLYIIGKLFFEQHSKVLCKKEQKPFSKMSRVEYEEYSKVFH